MTHSVRDFESLGEMINNLSLDTVFRIVNQYCVERVDNYHAPDVSNDPTGDIDIMGDGWEAYTGMTRQDSYNGAVLHSSEYIGAGIAMTLYEDAETVREDGKERLFTTVEIRDDDGSFPQGDAIGWAILFRDVEI